MPYVIIFGLLIVFLQDIVNAFYLGVVAFIIFGLFRYFYFLYRKSKTIRDSTIGTSNVIKSPTNPIKMNTTEANKVISGSASKIIKDIERNGALIIDKPWIEMILAGKKSWEMRATKFRKSGYIALIAKGTKTIVGIAEIQGYEGPLTLAMLKQHIVKHRVPVEQFTNQKYKWFVAMKLANIVRLPNAISYNHKSGSVIWVKLSEQTEVLSQLLKTLNSMKPKPSKVRNKAKKNEVNIVSAQDTKATMPSLLDAQNILPGVLGKVPISTKKKIFGEDKCMKDGLYHIKFNSVEYRFESKTPTLNALRKLKTAEWASFDRQGRRTWQTTESWIKAPNKM